MVATPTAGDDPVYRRFAAYIEAQVGVVLGPSKGYLVDSRLTPICAQYGLRDLTAVVTALERKADPGLKAAVIDAMTTHETLWFRDGHPYRILVGHVLPELASTTRRLRIWSAACSSGQEPYSLSIAVDEFLSRPRSGIRPMIEILATDVSAAMLAQAQTGVFAVNLGVRGLNQDQIAAYFDRSAAGFQLKPAYRHAVTFREFNLLADLGPLGYFDVVFLRNVLIYFSPATRTALLRRLQRVIRPGGYLFLGASESVAERSDGFQLRKFADGVAYQRPR